MRPRTSFLLLLALCAIPLLVASGSARQILVVDLSQADAPTQMLVASIQGVVNRDPSAAGVYVVRQAGDAAAALPSSETTSLRSTSWLALYPGDIAQVTPDELVAKVRERLAGQVLYDPAQEHSVNLAAAAAAILDAALTTKDLGLKTVLDARGRWPDRAAAYRYAIAQVLPQAAPDRLALIRADRTELRDYLAKERILAVDLDWRDREQAALLREILARLKPGSLVFGSQEMAADDELLQLLAQRQHLLVPISHAPNLSFHSAHPATSPLHQLDRLAPLAYQVMVTFVYEGGSDLGFALGRMRALWYDPERGRVPIGWTISPVVLDLAPAVFQAYCADASMSGNDELVLAPNGAGYFVPSRQVARSATATAANGLAAEWKPLLERMAPWVRAGDLHTAAIADRGPAADLEPALARYAAAGVRGILLGPGAKLESGLYGSLPVVAQTVRATNSYQALQAIRKAAQTNKYIYVSVDPSSLTPTDLAYIAGRLGEDYLVLRPREFLEVARQTTATHSQKPKEGAAEISDVLLRPAAPGPEDEVEVSATVRSQVKLDSVMAVYSAAGIPLEWTAPLKPGPDDTYSGTLPPALAGGKVSVRVRATDAENGVTWCAPVSFEVTAADADADGLSDALERLLRTDPAKADTDGDGWGDGNDAHPLVADHFEATYLWPLAPPGDAPYIIEGGGKVVEGVRAVSGDEKAVYEMPLSDAPSESQLMLQAVVGGDYRWEASSDGKQWQEIGSASGDARLASSAWEIPADYAAAGRLLIRLTDSTPEGGAPARVAELSIIAHPQGPSILVAGTDPPHPAVGLPVRVLASVFDPDGVSAVKLHYRINDGGTIAIPMNQQDDSQVYTGEIYGARDGDSVTYWVSAVDGKQNTAASRPLSFHLGVVPQETVSLLSVRDFEGPWEFGSEWDGSRWNPRKDSSDAATINIIGGAYRVWVLAAPRGGGIRVSLDGNALGATEAMARDGWQSVGTVELARGKHAVALTSVADARSGYAQVLITRDRRLTLSGGLVRDLYNSITVIAPRPGETVAGLVDIVATGTGNIGAVECFVDDARVGRQDSPPYRFRWNARHANAGAHAIEVRAFDHAGQLLLTTGLRVEVGK